MPLPFLTREFPGIGGSIKQRHDDFFVQEIPLYEPSGEGEHVFCEIQKTGLSTFDAIDRIAAALDISTRDIGYAGLKDARAISRQILSIWGTTEDAVMKLQIPGIAVQWAIRHMNKLRLGHLSGNRFAIKIRDVNPTDVIKVKAVVTEIERRGMPNYFGEQRFGHRGNNDKLGAAVVRGDARQLLGLLLGTPLPDVDDRKTQHAREAFDRGDLPQAMRLYPRWHGMERRILARLIKTKKPSAAARAVEHKLCRLWVSALQSRMFNEVVAKRIEALNRVMAGDLAWKHDSGAVFEIQAPEAEQPRCEAFEISPSGPLLGYRMSLPSGEPLAIEQACFAASGLTPADFRRAGDLKVKGARRPLRVQPKDLEFAGGVDEHGPHVTLAFTLPAGSFATVLLGEIMKSRKSFADDENESDGDSEDADADE
ncbi:MAG TPA: tRNA pseudouridine(13) synthase TruD [Tepidisphaeraceae bacterium]|jgi:tRNA pseudouridine13 synthase|nr:tRNA pseudouridine(13) synthase TruD [Tepidisphaeraceae bacterium]